MFEGFDRRRIDVGPVEINLVLGGSGSPLLLLHGYPQTHAMWHRVAPALAERYTLVAPDLRGYGDSDSPPGDPDHENYCKRVMARDQADVMSALGFDSFYLAGHDRGARVAHRLALDHPTRVRRMALLDIVPTHTAFASVNKDLATASYHWFFLIQPDGLPERMIGNDPEWYLRTKLARWSRVPGCFTEDAMAEYVRCFSKPSVIQATCEDYRAGASIDLDHDEDDLDSRIACPLLVLWGSTGIMTRLFDPLDVWKQKALDVRGRAIDCGHFLAEEAPDVIVEEFVGFFGT
jgi:haloacetate dehalogenase